ncbi:MAG: hypothetical protein COX15_00765 [Candidatus Colwellbacteria bacterium CG23_combo_of_CG06-09_8_20_14_all_42_19]|uniref:Glycerate kinase n=1 Tax=Candidatus Colwellbacteria bacterium CG23_combo_of_CG06-09_8_20_14_all_42_19 TaxID=1974541 RepID=A0A2H0ALZ2_9BACT|nr:MAG: hypothetical protein COX15_00765 [Candidatus Colwellbacteria bacterium CG23_combo_of_CG06-09_8_20_14_all_42_19]
MKIKNFDVLAVSELRRVALNIVEEGLSSIDTAKALRNTVRLNGDVLRIEDESYSVKSLKRIFVVAVGKCSLESAVVLENILGDRLSEGVAVDVRPGGYLKRVNYFRGTHPYPSEENVKAAKEVINLLSKVDQNDLVIFVISGGGSTLLCYPEDSSYKEESSIVKSLIKAGVTIQEMNTVRKHLSLARGGFLAKYVYPAKAVALIFSDVPGDDIGFIASGPTVKDTTTIDEAAATLAKYDIFGKCSLENCGLIETPKDKKYFENVKNIIVISNSAALSAMENKAKELGFKAKVHDGALIGEAREMGIKIARELHKLPSHTVLLYGGETTVTVRGSGRGGRNLEMALSAVEEVKENEVILPFASDGRDNGEFAGAICDIITREAIQKNKLDVQETLKENNGYPLFEKVGHYLFTGDTGSNVSDLAIAVKF